VSRARLGVLIVLVTASLAPATALAAMSASYLYTLSNFTGPIRQDWSRVSVDRERQEVYALYQNTVRIFNDSGMEVYRFGDDLDLGQMLDVAVDEGGDVWLLAVRDARSVIVRCDYRGRPLATITLGGLRRDFEGFVPNRLVVERGSLYLAASMDLKVVVADREGNVANQYDLFRLFELDEKDRGAVELGGFAVDRDGNLLMTIPVMFRAYVVTPAGAVSAFGRPGGAPGRFNIVAGIARDSKGNVLVADRLKCAVLVFDPRFNFVAQFATRGQRPGELILPDALAVDAGDRVYVTQAGKKGISVFKLTY
jgi:hypothetical protein